MNAEEINSILDKFSLDRTDIKITSKLEEKIFYLIFTGVIDTYNSLLIEKVVVSILSEIKIEKLVLEISKVNYMSSTGVGLFTSILKYCKNNNISIFLKNLQPKIKDVFDLLGFSNFFNIIDDSDSLEEKKEIFPKVIKCFSCNAALKIPRPGRFICKSCKANFVINSKGEIEI